MPKSIKEATTIGAVAVAAIILNFALGALIIYGIARIVKAVFA